MSSSNNIFPIPITNKALHLTIFACRVQTSVVTRSFSIKFNIIFANISLWATLLFSLKRHNIAQCRFLNCRYDSNTYMSIISKRWQMHFFKCVLKQNQRLPLFTFKTAYSVYIFQPDQWLSLDTSWKSLSQNNCLSMCLSIIS